MLSNNTFLDFIYKKNYLLIIAIFLVIISFFIDNYWSQNTTIKSVENNIENYIRNQELDFNSIKNDSSLLNKLVTNNYNEALITNLTKKKYFLFLYQDTATNAGSPLFWSTQIVLPSTDIIINDKSIGFVKLANGYFIWEKEKYNHLLELILIPIKWNYIVTNAYLKNDFVIGNQNNDINNNYKISTDSDAITIKSIEGKSLFYVSKKQENLTTLNTNFSILLRMIAAFLILFFIHLTAIFLASKKQISRAIFILIITVALLRSLSYHLPIPVNFRQFNLFDPAIYGSNKVLRSLGDLLINSILSVWILLFIRYQLILIEYKITPNIIKTKWVFILLSALALILYTLICGQILKSMVADSQISFDVINFSSLDGYSIIGFIVLCSIAISFFVFVQIVLFLVKPLLAEGFTSLYIAVMVVGLIFLTVEFNIALITFDFLLLAWLLLFLILVNNRYLVFFSNLVSSSRLIFWLFFFSLSITLVIVNENNVKELRNRKHYAEALSSKANPVTETLVNTMLTDFRNEILETNFDKFKHSSSNQLFKDSLINSNFSVYTNNYETKIYSYDANENILFNSDSTSFNDLNTILNTQAKPTGIADLYYYDEAYDKFSYIIKKNVVDSERKALGYIFILARLKQYKSDALSPELFSKGNENAIENSSVYAYAIYNNLQLINNHNEYAFATTLTKEQMPKEAFLQVNTNGYNELWYSANENSIVVIAKQNNYLIESITLFSYLFCTFLLLAGILWVLNILFISAVHKIQIKKYFQLSLRNQIHSTIIFISIFSFFVIATATFIFFIKRYNANNREKLSLTIHVLQNEVRSSLADLSVFDDVVKVYDDKYNEKLKKIISQISEIHAVDINFYDLDGNLKVSSVPILYNKGFVSTKIDPLAYFYLHQQKLVQCFKNEKIGELKFESYYVPVLDESGKEYAYLNIPYFYSERKLKLELAGFLVTIINLNAFIFLIAGIVALFITNRITRSFSFISNKMKQVNLGSKNEVIEWKRNDEIGELIKEYNTMVSKLNQSAIALAKSEREGAWREMARQVAHEIKNPLTPMKLSLQYLQRAIGNNAENVKDLTANVAQTLVEQINLLSQIAGEFSQFANIGNPHNTTFEIHEVLNLVIRLYATDDRIKLIYTPINGSLMIYADRTHINRLFTNLIQNAIQSVKENMPIEINITEQRIDKNILIKINDNGEGIPTEMRQKIFTPNFTTKTSGTGLGLAMCKGIVEEVKGKIWFETSLGMGTTFFIELPITEE